jgi:pimeloyl-ACP methyl ester carboxylesterase
MSFEDAYSFEFDYMDGEAGRRLATLSMRRRDLEPHALIVLPPGYERRIHHYSVLARAFADNGYEVLRFDLSNHLGLSDGEIAEFTMSSFEQDVRGILGWDRVLAGLPVVVVASSLSARAATRAILAGAPVAGCVMVLPVADV